MPNAATFFLNHNPNIFDRAVELGIDLTLAGHSHGGQLALRSSTGASPSYALETPYVSGWYERADSQLYVNRASEPPSTHAHRRPTGDYVVEVVRRV